MTLYSCTIHIACSVALQSCACTTGTFLLLFREQNLNCFIDLTCWFFPPFTRVDSKAFFRKYFHNFISPI